MFLNATAVFSVLFYRTSYSYIIYHCVDITWYLVALRLCNFYCAMLRRARYCYGKSSFRLSVRDVDVSWSHRLEYFKNNFTAG